MNSRAQFLRQGENNIFSIDFSGIAITDEFELAIAEAEALWKVTPDIKDLNLIVLADFSNTQLNPDIFELLFRYGRIVRATANKHSIVGLRPTSIVRDILRSYTGRKVKYFKTRKEALTWLTSNTLV